LADSSPATNRSLRAHGEARLAVLKSVRQDYEAEAGQIARFAQPARSRFLAQSRDRSGARRRQWNRTLFDPHGIEAFRTLTNGMTSGLSSASRPWFALKTADDGLMEADGVRAWLSAVERRMYAFLASTNFYGAAKSGYGEMGLFGTEACVMVEHPLAGAVCHALTFGEYWIALSDALVPDTLYRTCPMSVKQAVETFGQAVSPTVRNLYDRSQYEVLVEIYHAIEPDPDHDPNRFGSKAWRSFYWEAGARRQRAQGGRLQRAAVLGPALGRGGRGYLWPQPRHGGAARAARASDAGQAPQRGHRHDGQAREDRAARYQADRRTGPHRHRLGPRPRGRADPLSDALSGRRRDRRGNGQVPPPDRRALVRRPVQRDHQHGGHPAAQCRGNRQPQRGKADPAWPGDRARGGRETASGHRPHVRDPEPGRDAAPAPPALAGHAVRVEFVSILQQMQRMVGIGQIERVVGFVGNLAGAHPEVLDRIDFDEALDEYAWRAGAPARILRPAGQVAALRQARAQAAQEAQQAAQIGQMVPAMKDAAAAAELLSRADVGGESLLKRLIQP
jgi:hypothetical protein